MLSRMHQKLGTAGFVIAIIALVAAMTGGAIAALSPADKKVVKKEAKKYSKQFSKQFSKAFAIPGPAGPQGLPGAAGKNGTNGTNGTNGAPGAPGDDGASVELGDEAAGTANCEGFGGTTVQVEGDPGSEKIVCNGETGFTEVLPEGKSLKGTWDVGFTTTENPKAAESMNISYNIPLSESATINVIKADGTARFGNVANCPGTAAAPAANPDNLCIYTTIESGVAEWNASALLNNAFGYVDNLVIEETATPAPGFAWGTWAVTAKVVAP